MAMLEKNILISFYIFGIVASVIILFCYGFCLYACVHLCFTLLVSTLGIWLLYNNMKLSYCCFGILFFYMLYQILYSPWLIHKTYAFLWNYGL